MRRYCLAVRVVVLASVFGAVALAAAGEERRLPVGRLSTSDPEVVAALSRCRGQSATCRGLIDGIEGSATVVYITRGSCGLRMHGSCLRFLTAAAGIRYLHIILDRDLLGGALVSATAHELQHVTEVVRAPQVVDVGSFRSLYVRIGIFIRGEGMREEWETREAQRVSGLVGNDVKRFQRGALLASK